VSTVSQKKPACLWLLFASFYVRDALWRINWIPASFVLIWISNLEYSSSIQFASDCSRCFIRLVSMAASIWCWFSDAETALPVLY